MGVRERTERPIRLLIAEDEDMFAELIAVLATHEGIDVLGRARNGQEAIELAAALQPNVIVMDIGMPLLDGICATSRIRKRDPGVQVVIFTSSEEERDVRRAREVGAAAYVQKAHIDAVLVAAIRRAAGAEGDAPQAASKMVAHELAPATP